MSNIIDSTTSLVPEHLKEFEVLERNGIRIGIIGLVEQYVILVRLFMCRNLQKITAKMPSLFREWITTVHLWPPEFVYKPMKEIGLELSMRLRDPEGEYRCDFIIALTHSR